MTTNNCYCHFLVIMQIFKSFNWGFTRFHLLFTSFTNIYLLYLFTLYWNCWLFLAIWIPVANVPVDFQQLCLLWVSFWLFGCSYFLESPNLWFSTPVRNHPTHHSNNACVLCLTDTSRAHTADEFEQSRVNTTLLTFHIVHADCWRSHTVFLLFIQTDDIDRGWGGNSLKWSSLSEL